MAVLNPSVPRGVGLEWWVTRQPNYVFGSPVRGIGGEMTVASIIDANQLAFYQTTAPGGSSPAQAGAVLVSNLENTGGTQLTEVYNTFADSLSTLPTSGWLDLPNLASYATNPNVLIILPAADFARQNMTGVSDNTNLYANVDEAFPATTTADNNRFNPSAAGCYWNWFTNNTNVRRKLSGRRIVAVQIIASLHAGNVNYAAITPYIGINVRTPNYANPVGYFPASPWISTGINPSYYVSTWLVNPATGIPWSIADIEAFAATSAGNSVSLNSPFGFAILYSTNLLIWTVDENRIGRGSVNNTTPAGQWNTMVLNTPDYYNMLWTDEADFESSVGDWTGTLNCSVTSSLTFAKVNTHSLRLSSTAGGNMTATSATGTGGVPVTAGKIYAVAGWIRTGVSARSTGLNILWYDATGAFLSTTTGATSNDSTTFVQYKVTGTAPANARYAAVQIAVAATGGAAELHYIDAVMMIANTSDATLATTGGTFIAGGSARGTVPLLVGEVFTVMHSPATNASAIAALTDDESTMVPGTTQNIYDIVTDATGLITQTPQLTNVIPAMLIRSSTNTYPVGTQPYTEIIGEEVFGAAADFSSLGTVVEQLFTVGTAKVFGALQVVLSASNGLVDDLIVYIKRDSDDVIMATVTIAAADLVVGSEDAKQRVRVNFSPVYLAATVYYLQFVSSSFAPWYVWGLDSNATNTLGTPGNATGYDGATSYETAGGVVATDADVMAMITAVPPAPDLFAVVTI
jgi:hypothetical protein